MYCRHDARTRKLVHIGSAICLLLGITSKLLKARGSRGSLVDDYCRWAWRGGRGMIPGCPASFLLKPNSSRFEVGTEFSEPNFLE